MKKKQTNRRATRRAKPSGVRLDFELIEIFLDRMHTARLNTLKFAGVLAANPNSEPETVAALMNEAKRIGDDLGQINAHVAHAAHKAGVPW